MSGYTESFADLLGAVTKSRAAPRSRARSAGLVHHADTNLKKPPHVNQLLNWAQNQAKYKISWRASDTVNTNYDDV